MSHVELEPVDRVQITILMDNVTDPLLVDQEAVARINWPKALMGALPTAPAQVSAGSGVPDALIAEPGFSALVRIEKAGGERTLLFDTGVSAHGMVENMRRLGIAPADVRYARKLTGHDAVAAIVGGFHLSGPMFEPIIEPTVTALDAFSPSLLVPAHCTGWRAVHRLAARFPDAFVMSTVGTTITL